MTANGVTSEPVPAVVGMATIIAFSPSGGILTIRLRMSMKRVAKSSKLNCGCSYISHMILAASIGEPPPNAMMTSAWKLLSCSSPTRANWMVGSGATSENTWYRMPSSVSRASMEDNAPLSYKNLSVTTKARLRPARSPKAVQRQPYLK